MQCLQLIKPNVINWTKNTNRNKRLWSRA